MNQPSPPIRLAVIGAGAIAEAHLPVAAAAPLFDVRVVVDQAPGRARALADRFGVPEADEDHTRLAGRVDAAIIALPHHLHAPISLDLLAQGIHLLVEKPMALTAAECDAMIAAAGNSGAVLAVGQTRRFFNAYRLAKGIFERGLLGRITSFDLREGSIYNWPVRSDFMFRRETGGGVLRDTGAHTLDALLWWLGEPAEIEYRDNARGGVESDCELRLTYPSGAMGIVELSRTRNLRNTYRFTGELASLELETQLDGRVTLEVNDLPIPLAGKAPHEDVWGIFRRQLDDFGESILHRRDPFAPGADARRVAALIERCLAARQPLHFPWEADER